MSKRIPEQMPGWLAKIDDPWGINWRLINAVKRFNPKRTGKLLNALFRSIQYQRPVFIVGVPRSGTTLLFDLLRSSPELDSLRREGHDLWRTFHHPRYCRWTSDRIGPDQVRPMERRYVNAYLHAHGVRTPRFVEKTPETSLRIPYILDLFPDALFLVIKRNPADVINSLINGWRHPQGRYRSYFVPEKLTIQDYPHRHQWCFALIDGWRDLTAASIPEIALAQWRSVNQALLQVREELKPAQWLEIHFEQLLQEPEQILATICAFSGIRNRQALQLRLAELIAHPVNAMSPPGIGKWKLENQAEIEPLLPSILDLSAAMGYSFQDGDFRHPDPLPDDSFSS